MSDRGSGFRFFFSILTIVFSVFFCISIIKFSYTGGSFSFSAFLDYMSKVPPVTVDYTYTWENLLSYFPDWLSFFRNLLQPAGYIINTAWWLLRNVYSVIVYITYVVRFLFV